MISSHYTASLGDFAGGCENHISTSSADAFATGNILFFGSIVNNPGNYVELKTRYLKQHALDAEELKADVVGATHGSQ